MFDLGRWGRSRRGNSASTPTRRRTPAGWLQVDDAAIAEDIGYTASGGASGKRGESESGEWGVGDLFVVREVAVQDRFKLQAALRFVDSGRVCDGDALFLAGGPSDAVVELHVLVETRVSSVFLQPP